MAKNKKQSKTQVETQPKPKPMFAKGDRVRVKAGVACPSSPDLPLGGWTGEVVSVHDSWDSEPSYIVRWSEETLQNAHPVYRKRCERDGRCFDEGWLNQTELEPDPGGPLSIEQPTQILTRPLSPKRQNDRIRTVFGLTTDDAIPVPDEATCRQYEEHLAGAIAFPLEAWYVGGPLGRPRPVTVLRPLECDPSAGARRAPFEVRDHEQTFPCPLLGLDISKKSPAFQALNDYYCWLDDLLDRDAEAFVHFEGGAADAEEEAYSEDEDDSWQDEDDSSDDEEDLSGDDGAEEDDSDEDEEDDGEGEDDWEEDEEDDWEEQADDDQEEEAEDDEVRERKGPGSVRLPELPPEPLRLAKPKVGRNDPCPCGSGKKYKKCCLSKDCEEAARQEAEEEEPRLIDVVQARGSRFRMPKPRPKPTDTVYQLKITLDGTDPPIWRRFQVKDCTLDELHGVLQVVMGWENDHLYQFQAGKQQYSPGEHEFGAFSGNPSQDSTRTVLSELVKRKGSKFGYEYDFGDSWWHVIEVEERLTDQPEFGHPVCLEGELACPPEDCGGIYGYHDCLEALKNPDDPDYADRLEGIGDYDPDDFDPHRVNRVFARWRGR